MSEPTSPEIPRLVSCVVFVALLGGSIALMSALIYGAALWIGGW